VATVRGILGTLFHSIILEFWAWCECVCACVCMHVLYLCGDSAFARRQQNDVLESVNMYVKWCTLKLHSLFIDLVYIS